MGSAFRISKWRSYRASAKVFVGTSGYVFGYGGWSYTSIQPTKINNTVTLFNRICTGTAALVER